MAQPNFAPGPKVSTACIEHVPRYAAHDCVSLGVAVAWVAPSRMIRHCRIMRGSAARRWLRLCDRSTQFDAVLLGAVGVHLANPNDPHVCGVADGVSPAHRISSRETALPSTPTLRRPTSQPRGYERACVHRVARVHTHECARMYTRSFTPVLRLRPAAACGLHRTYEYSESSLPRYTRTCARQGSRSSDSTLPARRRRRSLAKGRSTTTYTSCSRGRCCKCCSPVA